MNKDNNEITWIDSTKGLGILLVILGHCFSPMSFLTQYLYSFHIALFFFISGYLYNNKKYDKMHSAFVSGKFKRLMIPYFTYGAVTYVIWLLVGRNFGVNSMINVSPIKPLLGLFYGNGIDDYLVFNISLWFLPALFSTIVLYHFISSYMKNKYILFTAVFLIAGLGIIDSMYNDFMRLPWGINIALVAVLFAYKGNAYKGFIEKIFHNIHGKFIMLAISIGFIGAGLLLHLYNGGISFNSHSYSNPIVFAASASSSILGLLILVKYFLDCKFLQFCGKNSLRFFALHILSFSVISTIVKFVFRLEFLDFKKTLEGRLVYFVASIMLVSIFSIILNYIIRISKNKKYCTFLNYL